MRIRLWRRQKKTRTTNKTIKMVLLLRRGMRFFMVFDKPAASPVPGPLMLVKWNLILDCFNRTAPHFTVPRRTTPLLRFPS